MKKTKTTSTPENGDLPGYPLYPPGEDIYSQGIKESEADPEDPKTRKKPVEDLGSLNEKDFRSDMSGDGLDVPGSELDDEQEAIGSEDEENNLYSLGGDSHENQEEDKTQRED